MAKRNMIHISIARYNKEGGIDEIPLLKCRLDSKEGLLVFPKNIPKGYHLHYYGDAETKKITSHIKDEKTGKKLSYHSSFRKLKNSLATKELKKDSLRHKKKKNRTDII